METRVFPIYERIGLWLAASLYLLWTGTWRLRRYNVPALALTEPVLWAHWHGDELVLVATEASPKNVVLSSLSKDGSRMAYLLGRFGYRIARGSSSRGGAAGLKTLVDAVRRERSNAALAVDGPKGPAFVAKAGIVKLAQLSGAPIIPLAAAAKRRILFRKAWNRCYFPLPFSSVVIVYGEPLRIPRQLSPEESDDWQKRVTEAIAYVREKAEEEFSTQRGVAQLV